VHGAEAYKQYSRQNDGRNRQFRDNHTVPVLGIPDVVVREAVHVRLQLAIVPVDVRHEEYVRQAIHITIVQTMND
jgi:hypothetical protein